MNREITTEDLARIADDAGLAVEEFRVDYSGRNMYGETCLGLVTGQGVGIIATLAFAFSANLQIDGEDVSDLFASTRTDSMGVETVYYWPNITVTGAPNGE